MKGSLNTSQLIIKPAVSSPFRIFRLLRGWNSLGLFRCVSRLTHWSEPSPSDMNVNINRKLGWGHFPLLRETSHGQSSWTQGTDEERCNDLKKSGCEKSHQSYPPWNWQNSNLKIDGWGIRSFHFGANGLFSGAFAVSSGTVPLRFPLNRKPIRSTSAVFGAKVSGNVFWVGYH